MRNIWLDVGDSILFKDFAETPTGEQPLPCGDGEGDMVGDKFERIDILLRYRLFDKHRTHALDFVANFNGKRRCHFAVEIEGKFDVGANPFAHGVSTFDELIDDGGWLMAAPLAGRSSFIGSVSALG